MKIDNDRLTDLLIRKEIMSDDICKEIHLSKEKYMKIRSGEVDPEDYLIRRIANALNVPVQEIIQEEGEA